MFNTVTTVLSRLIAPVWPITIIALVLGAFVGSFAIHEAEPGYLASAVVKVNQPVDPNQIISGAASPLVNDSFMAGEMAYLSSPGFYDAVGKEMGLPYRVSVTVSEQGQSQFVTISSEGATLELARKIVDSAVKVFSDSAQQRVKQRDQAAIDSLTKVLDKIVLPPAEGATPPTPAPGSGVIDQLLTERGLIEVDMERPVVQVVQPAAEAAPHAVAPFWSLGLIGGALIGGCVGLGAALVWRSKVGLITSRSALVDEFEHVMAPVVSLPGSSEVGRTLYAQLQPPRQGTIVVIGASDDSGASTVTQLIAAAAHADEPVDGLGGAAKHGARLTVVDGGSVENSPGLPEVVGSAQELIVVVALKRDVLDSVRIAVNLAQGHDIPVSIVGTRRSLLGSFSRS